MKNPKTQMLTEGGIMIALAAVLSQITPFQMPQGGSISLGGMVPILLFALRRGTGAGVLMGATFGLLDFILKPSFFSIPQMILDYPVAYGMLGLAGLGRTPDASHAGLGRMFSFSMVGILGRYAAAVASGFVFFSDYAPAGMNPLWYSLTYNATYLLPDAVIAVLLLTLLYRPVMKRLPEIR